MFKRLLYVCTALAAVLLCSRAEAVDFELHGFFTTGYARSDSSVPYLNSITNSGTFSEVSDAGAQISAQVSPRLNVKLQFLAQGSQDASFTPEFDLAEAQYVLSSGHEVLGGRLRLPLFLISDYRYVGTLYPWTIPPPELYAILPVGSVGTDETFTGINFINQLAQFGDWVLINETFVGGSTGNVTPPQQEINYNIERLFGTTFSFEKPTAQLRFAYLNSYNQSTTTSNTGPQGAPMTVDSSIGLLQFVTVGGRWDLNGWLFQAEGAKLFAENQRFQDIYSVYGTIGAPLFSRRFLLHETVATAIDAAHSNSGIGQTSFTTGINAIFFENSLVAKFDWQRAHPSQTSGQPPAPGNNQGSALFSATPPDELNVYYASLSASF